jgi:hypothetical protein
LTIHKFRCVGAFLLAAGCAQAEAPPPPAPEPSSVGGGVIEAPSAAVSANMEEATTAPGKMALRSGLYEELLVGVDASGRVTGSYHMEQGEGVVKTCAFTFSGQNRGGTAAIRAHGSPRGVASVLTGRLTAADDGGVVLSLPGARDLPGCGLVADPMMEDPDGMGLSRTGDGAWTELVEVRAARAALRPSPGAPAGRAYVVKGDVVGVLERRDGAVRVVYPSYRASPSQGWVSAAELAQLAP